VREKGDWRREIGEGRLEKGDWRRKIVEGRREKFKKMKSEPLAVE